MQTPTIRLHKQQPQLIQLDYSCLLFLFLMLQSQNKYYQQHTTNSMATTILTNGHNSPYSDTQYDASDSERQSPPAQAAGNKDGEHCSNCSSSEFYLPTSRLFSSNLSKIKKNRTKQNKKKRKKNILKSCHLDYDSVKSQADLPQVAIFNRPLTLVILTLKIVYAMALFPSLLEHS